MPYCPACGSPVASEDDRCQSCGESVPDPSVDGQNDPDSRDSVTDRDGDHAATSTVETMRWSWRTLTSRPAVVVSFLLSGYGIPNAILLTPADANVVLSVAVLALFALWLFSVPVVVAVGCLTAADAFFESPDSLADRTRLAVRRVPALAVLGVIVGVPVGGLFVLPDVAPLAALALLAPVAYLVVKLSLAVPACLVDRLGPVESLKTSWSVTKGNLPAVVGLWVGFAVLSLSSGYVGATVPALDVATTLVGPGVLGPLLWVAFTHVYLENRPARFRV